MQSIQLKLRWYRNRWSTMSGAELLFRSQRYLGLQMEKLGIGIVHSPAPADFSKVGTQYLCSPLVTSAEYCSAADEVMVGQIKMVGSVIAQLPRECIWNRNPVSGELTSMGFGKSIDYRNPAKVGDIKYFWILNRHHHLVSLAQAYAFTSNQEYVDEIARQWRTWLDQSPYMKGLNWTSALELSIRLLNWTVVWQLIGREESPVFEGKAGQALKTDLLRSVYQQVHFIRRYLSRHSSANNHLIGELVGIFVASRVFNYWDEFEVWGTQAAEELEHQVALQVTEDGVCKESSTFYQCFVLEFLLIAGWVDRSANQNLSNMYYDRVECMLEFLASIMDVGGTVPNIGDADEARVLSLAPGREEPMYDSVLTNGFLLLRQPEVIREGRWCSQTAQWFCEPPRTTDIATQSAPLRRSFPEGGFHVLGDRLDTPTETRIVFYSNDLGYPSIAAHGHADALSFTLSIGGEQVLIDPGTFSYQTDTNWRDYFRGTSGHNTVTVDAQDQSIIGGKFMWLRPVSSQCNLWETSESTDRVIATHDGYQRLQDPVRHERELTYAKHSQTLTVIDRLWCKGSHQVEQVWHFADHCRVREKEGDLLVSGARFKAVVRVKFAADLSLAHGELDPISGWSSPSYKSKVPSITAKWRSQIVGSVVQETTIQLYPNEVVD